MARSVLVASATLLVALPAFALAPAALGAHSISVPTSVALLSTFVAGSAQKAIDRAAAGSVIHLPAGTIREQLVIAKSVTLVGAGQGKTFLVPPRHPRATENGDIFLVRVTDGARVTLAALTLRAPWLCPVNPSNGGETAAVVGVHEHADFTLRDAAIEQQGPPNPACVPSNSPDEPTGVQAGYGPNELASDFAGSATLDHVRASYGFADAATLGPGSSLRVFHSRLSGSFNGGNDVFAADGARAVVRHNVITTNGAFVGVVAVGAHVAISQNQISGFRCRALFPSGVTPFGAPCGANFFTQIELVGVVLQGCSAGSSGPICPRGTLTPLGSVTHNLFERNDIAVIEVSTFSARLATVAHNVARDTTDYAFAAFDARATFSDNVIRNARWAVGVFAAPVPVFAKHTVVVMDEDVLVGITVARANVQVIPPATAKVVFED